MPQSSLAILLMSPYSFSTWDSLATSDSLETSLDSLDISLDSLNTFLNSWGMGGTSLDFLDISPSVPWTPSLNTRHYQVLFSFIDRKDTIFSEPFQASPLPLVYLVFGNPMLLRCIHMQHPGQHHSSPLFWTHLSSFLERWHVTWTRSCKIFHIFCISIRSMKKTSSIFKTAIVRWYSSSSPQHFIRLCFLSAKLATFDSCSLRGSPEASFYSQQRREYSTCGRFSWFLLSLTGSSHRSLSNPPLELQNWCP